MSGVEDGKGLELALLNYLKQRGYAKAEEALRLEMLGEKGQSGLKAMSVEESAERGLAEAQTSLLRQVFAWSNMEGSPDWYAESFRELRRWVEGSLDVYRAELTGVLFPVLVHCYLQLVARGFARDATSFLLEFRRDYMGSYPEELNRLSALCFPQDIPKNEVARRFLEHKVDITLSAFAHQLLISFLQEHRRLLLLRIINENINITVVSTGPISVPKAGSNVVPPTGYDLEQVNAVNQSSVPWGVLKQLDDLQMSALKSKPGFNANEALAARKVEESAIPLPEISEDQKLEILDHLQKRVFVSKETLPSIAFYTFLNSRQRLNCCGISPSGRTVAGGFTDSAIRVWDLTNENIKSTKASTAKMDQQAYQYLLGHTAPVYSMDFSNDGRFLLSGSADHSVRLWMLEQGSNLVAYKGHNYPVWGVKFSPLDYYFASCSNDRTARLWSTERIHPLRIFSGHLSDVDCVQFHPNCNLLATGSGDKSARVWDIQSGECVRIFSGHQGGILSLAFSPNGRILATGGVEDNLVILWDIASGKKLYELSGHKDAIKGLCFSQEGTLLASGSLDQTVRLWDTQNASDETSKFASHSSESSVKVFPTKSTPVHLCQFSPRNLLYAAGVYSSSAAPNPTSSS